MVASIQHAQRFAVANFNRKLNTTSCITGVIMGATVALAPLTAVALPQTPNVVHGDINVTSTTNTTTINQATDRGIINWNSFDIGVGETTHFNQPNASSITLNRITGSQNPSQIHGTLSATGNVVLVNPNGVHFGANSRVDVNGLIASTADISNENFLNNNFTFDKPGNPNATIINKGSITAKQGGLVALVAPGVENHGVIRADRGAVAMGAGDGASFDFYGDKLINFEVDGETAKGITNTGTVAASGGTIYMTAAAATQVVDNVINTSGIVEASSAHMEGGVIVLGGGDAGVKVSGTVKATGSKGGTVTVDGGNIALENATIDVSGAHGGGDIIIGGNGKVDATNLAATTTIDANTDLLANANESGDGGNIILWSEEATRFEGYLSARGVRDGGFAEVSSVGLLGYYGLADLTGVNGENGLLLLDPDRVVIGTNNRDDAEIADGTVNSADGSDTFQIAASAVEAALNAASVVIEAITSITVNEAINGSTSPAGNGLTLDAATVNVNNDITLNDAILNLYGDRINVRGNINTGTGNIRIRNVGGTGAVDRFLLSAGNTIMGQTFNATPGINTLIAQGNFDLLGGLSAVINTSANFSGDITSANSRLDLTGGNITLNNVTAKRVLVKGANRIVANGNITANGGINNGEVDLAASGNITLNGSVGSTNANTSIVSSGGNVSIAGAATAGNDMTLGGNTITLENGTNVTGALAITANTNLQLGNALNFGSENIDTSRITILDNDASIQQGIDLVNTGGTVRVDAGNYTQGGINVNNGVHLIGDGKDQTFINAVGNNNALVFGADADGVRVTGLSLSGANFASIKVDAAGDVINGLTFSDISSSSDNGSGLLVRGGTTVTNLRILNSMLNNNAFSGMLINGASTVAGLVVRNTTFDGNGFNGFRVENGSDLSDANFGTNSNGQTTFRDNGTNGAHIEAGNNVTFNDVIFSGNDTGLRAETQSGDTLTTVTVRNSTIEDNNSAGLLFNAKDDTIINRIRIYDNVFGSNQPVQISYEGDVNVRLSGGAVRDLDDQDDRNEVIDDLISSNTFGTLTYVTDELDGNWVGDTTLWGNIQPAIDAAASDDWVNIGEGTYDETLLIRRKDLNLIGLTDDKANVVIQPTTLSGNTFTDYMSNNVLPIVMAEDATVTVQNLTIDGSELGEKYGSSDRLVGIGLNHAGGTINNIAVTSIYDDGSEMGTGIYAQGSELLVKALAGPAIGIAAPVRPVGPDPFAELIISNSDISDVQFSGIHMHGFTLNAIILENTLTGNGKKGKIAQEMIKLSGSVNGGVFGNTITDFGIKKSIGIHAEQVGFGADFIDFIIDDLDDLAISDVPVPTYFIEGNGIEGTGNKSGTIGIKVENGIADGDFFPVPFAFGDCLCGDEPEEIGLVAVLDNTISGVKTGIRNKADFVDIVFNDINAKNIGINDSGFATFILETTVEGAKTGLQTDGVTDVYESTFIDNDKGILVEKGGDLVIGDTTVTGGDVGLKVKGKNSIIEFTDMYGGSSFDGQSEYAIELTKKAMDDEDIDVSTVYFNGQRGDTIDPATGEGLVFDENDNDSVGDIVFLGNDTTGGGGGGGGGGTGTPPTVTDTVDGGGDDTTTGGGDDTTTGGGSDTTTGGGDDTTTGGGGTSFGSTPEFIDEQEQDRSSGLPSVFSFFGETIGKGFNFSGTFADLSLLGQSGSGGGGNYQGLSPAQLGGLEPAAGGDASSADDVEDNCANSYLSGGYKIGYSAGQCQ